MSDKKVLTKEIAEKFLVNHASVDLNEFATMEPEARQLFRERGINLLSHVGPGRNEPRADSFENDTLEFGEDALRAIPGCYYVLAVFSGVTLLIFTMMVSGDLSADVIGGMIGWIIGAVLATFAAGRLLQLVQRISDDIRVIRDGTMNGSEETGDKGESVSPPEDDSQ